MREKKIKKKEKEIRSEYKLKLVIFKRETANSNGQKSALKVLSDARVSVVQSGIVFAHCIRDTNLSGSNFEEPNHKTNA